MPKSKATCIVELLDGTEINVDNKYLHHAEEFLDHVCGYIGVAERDYFGLRYTNSKDGKISWLDMNEPLIRQLRKALRRRFKLGIQFFPDTIHVLQDEVTRYQFVLQARENLLTGRWSCSMPTQALLASYIVQAEFGDYDVEKHEDYLEGLQFACGQNADFMEKVCLFHKNHRDISPSDADWLYMKTARKMVMYGMDVYDVVDGDGNVLTLGIDVYGIHILFLNTVLHSFVWPLVSKIYCHGKEILITIKVTSNDQSECITIGFMLTTERDARRVSKACNQNKDFHNLGSVKKPLKKPNKPIPCTHISTRVLPDDFKRVDSFEYSKLFEREADAHIADGDSDETSDRKDSLEEDSSKDTTNSNPDELNDSKRQSEDELGRSANVEEVSSSIADVDLDTTEESMVNINMLTIDDSSKDEYSTSSGVVLSEEYIAVAEVMDEIVCSVEENNAVACEVKDVIFSVEEQPVETSEPITRGNIDVNVIVNDRSDIYMHNNSTKDNIDAYDSMVLANTIEFESGGEGAPEGGEGDVDVDLLIMEEYDVIESNCELITR